MMDFKKSMVVFLSFVVSILFFLSPNVHAQEKEIFTLEKSIAEAFENNWTLKATGEKIEQAVNVKNQARSDLMPKLGMSYGYTRLNEDPTFRSDLGAGIAVGTQDNYQWKGTVSQPIFTGFSLISSYQLAALGIDQSELDYELGKLDLALRVKQAYFGVLIEDTRVEVAEKEVKSRESSVNVARSFYDVGMIPVNDLLKAVVELDNTQQNVMMARNNAKLARSMFNTVLSRPIHMPVEV